jgi:hypothetical protein
MCVRETWYAGTGTGGRWGMRVSRNP